VVSPFVDFLDLLKKLPTFLTSIFVDRHFFLLCNKHSAWGIEHSVLRNLIHLEYAMRSALCTLRNNFISCLLDGILNSVGCHLFDIIKSNLSFCKIHLNILNPFELIQRLGD